jgi:hypothetical protein
MSPAAKKRHFEQLKSPSPRIRRIPTRHVAVSLVFVRNYRSRTMSATATRCPVSRKQFTDNAKPITVSLNGQPVLLEVKEFSTGSLGYYANGKVTLDVGGTLVKFQVGFQLTAIGSKELPRE